MAYQTEQVGQSMEALEKELMDGCQKSEAGEALCRFPQESSDPILRIDDSGTLLYFNQAAQSVLREWQPHIGDSLPHEFMASLNRCLENEACAATGIEIKIEKRRIVFTPVRLENSNFLFLQGRDVTLFHHYEEHLKLLASVFENVAESIIITDTHGVILAVNPAFTLINGYTADEAIGRTARRLKSNRHDAEFYRWMWNEIKAKGIWKGRVWNRRKNGDIYPALLSISAIQDENGLTTHYCSVCHDITGGKEAMDKLQFEASHDGLTGLPNMQLFYDRLDTAFQRALQERSMFAIMMLDIDGFSQINERFGYPAGDLLLQKTARRLRRNCRFNETLSRPAADEYIMILDIADRTGAAVEERAVQTLNTFSVPVDLESSSMRVTVSIGIAVYPLTADDMHTLLEQALAALNTAKQNGGNQFVVYQR